MSFLGSDDHWREAIIGSRIFVSSLCKEHLQDLSKAIQGSHVHWREATIVSRIFASPCCKEHLQDLCVAIPGSLED